MKHEGEEEGQFYYSFEVFLATSCCKRQSGPEQEPGLESERGTGTPSTDENRMQFYVSFKILNSHAENPEPALGCTASVGDGHGTPNASFLLGFTIN